MAVELIIGVLVYLAIGVIVLSVIEGTFGLVIIFGFEHFVFIVAWPLLLLFRQYGQQSLPSHSAAAPLNQELIGMEAEAITDLKPWGKIRVGEKQMDARAEIGFVPTGAKVNVLSFGNGGVVVRGISTSSEAQVGGK